MFCYKLLKRIQYFISLPGIFVRVSRNKECQKAKITVAIDLLYLSVSLKCCPSIYMEARLWDVKRENFKYYYGQASSLYARERFCKSVQNREYQAIFDNKYVSDAYLRGVTTLLPKRLGVIEPDEFNEMYIRNLLVRFGVDEVIVKPIEGYRGQGVFKLQKKGEAIIVNGGNGEIKGNDFRLSEVSIVQECIRQDQRISEIYPGSVNTIRVHTLLTLGKNVLILGAFMRFGSKGNIVDNVGSGGIAVGINLSSGKLLEVGYNLEGVKHYYHPDTRYVFKNFQVPKWKQVQVLAMDIQRKTFFYKFLGFDIAVTERGPVLIEINANPELGYQELFTCPLLSDRVILEEFSKYDLLYSKTQRRLLSA